MYKKNPTGELLEKTNDQYIEDNISILEEWFMKNDDIGMMCNKDNIEDYFSAWLEKQSFPELVKIIKKHE